MHLRHLRLPGVPQIYRTQMPQVSTHQPRISGGGAHGLLFLVRVCERASVAAGVAIVFVCRLLTRKLRASATISQHGKYVIIVLREHKNHKWETIARYLKEFHSINAIIICAKRALLCGVSTQHSRFATHAFRTWDADWPNSKAKNKLFIYKIN